MTRGSFTFTPAAWLHRSASVARRQYAHPDLFDQDGTWRRCVFINDAPVLVTAMRSGRVDWESPSEVCDSAVIQRIEGMLIPMRLSDKASAHLPPALRKRLERLSPLVHIASASLEEAVMKAIIRQVIRASHAKRLIHDFVTTFGMPFDRRRYPNHHLFPTADRIRSLSERTLRKAGLGFKARHVRSAIDSLQDESVRATIMDSRPADAVPLLEAIPGVGPWTARVAVSDFAADWSLYPVSDLAVRTWARRLWPQHNWPDEPGTFERVWRTINGDNVDVITFYLLAAAQDAAGGV